MGKSIADAFRKAAHQWVARVSIEELATTIPATALDGLFGPGTRGIAKVKKKRSRRSRRTAKAPDKRKALKERKLTPEEGKMIRLRMKSIPRNSPDHRKLREEICEKIGITPKQFGAALHGHDKE